MLYYYLRLPPQGAKFSSSLLFNKLKRRSWSSAFFSLNKDAFFECFISFNRVGAISFKKDDFGQRKEQKNTQNASKGITQCLKITGKVSFNTASEASYIYRQKFIRVAKKWSTWQVLEELKLVVKQYFREDVTRKR